MHSNTVVLHVGMHKTGTSSIQATLARHRGRLLEHRIVFPKSLPPNHSHFFYDAFARAPQDYHANRARGFTAETIAARTAETLERLGAELGSQDGRTIVFSAEDACTLTEAEIATVRRTLERVVRDPVFRVVLYTRHPVDFVASAVQENVKGNAMTIARSKHIHINTTHHKYRRIHARYAEVFGEEAIAFRTFEGALAAPGGLIADFLRTLGPPAPAVEEVRMNESIADEVVLFLSARTEAGRGPLPPEDAGLLFALPGNKGGLLSPEERDEIWRLAREDVAFLEERFAIAYGSRRAALPEQAEALKMRFLASVPAILPRLSPAVRDDLVRHLAGGTL